MGWSSRPDAVAQGCVCRVIGSRLGVQRDAVFVGGRCASDPGVGCKQGTMLLKHLVCARYRSRPPPPPHLKAGVSSEAFRELK